MLEEKNVEKHPTWPDWGIYTFFQIFPKNETKQNKNPKPKHKAKQFFLSKFLRFFYNIHKSEY